MVTRVVTFTPTASADTLFCDEDGAGKQERKSHGGKRGLAGTLSHTHTRVLTAAPRRVPVVASPQFRLGISDI
jgi:hypothetical protein